MLRKRYEWKLKERTIQLGDRTLIVAVLNVTPDSFSDGGKYLDPDRAFARAMELEEEGADIIDIGAESTSPGSTRVAEAEELRRLIPVLKRLHGKLNIPISVDTYKAAVAELALEHGAEIINDPSGLTFDAQVARVAASQNAGLIVNHMRGTPETWAKLPSIPDVMGTVGKELDAAVNRAMRSGLDRKQIVIDPGLGFGKRKEQNSELLARLWELASLGLPILVGPSRKHFVARETEEETLFATAGAVAAAILAGAHMVRVHDVKQMRAVAQVVDAVMAAVPEPKEEPKRQDRQRMRDSERPEEGNRPVRRFPEPRPVRQPEEPERPREEQPIEARPAEERPPEERPRQERPREERPRDDRPRDDRPRYDRPREDRPRESRPPSQSGPRDYRGPGGPRDSRGPGGFRDSRGPGGPRDSRGPGGPRDSRGPGGFRDSRGPGGPRDSRGPSGPRDSRGPGGPRDSRGPAGPRDYRSPGGPRDSRGPGGPRGGARGPRNDGGNRPFRGPNRPNRPK